MEPVISTKYGKVNGKIIEDLKGSKCCSFQGIPYAEPPVGDLRFRAPKPPKSWPGVLDCTRERSECLAKDLFQQHRIVGSEDCLFLNVYTPQLPQPDNPPLPVMVWIHGGGFNMGSSKTDIYGPEYLLTGNVVLVTFNYRLGVFGLLSLEDPSLNVPGNNAFKDMVLALKWTEENIQNFNGDPGNVTIFGESAGGASVHLLVLSPSAKGLFHKAILQSGCALNPWPSGVRFGEDLARALKLEAKNEKDLLAALKTLPAETILQAQNQLYDGLEAVVQRHMGFVVEKPCDEPAFLTEEPLGLIKSGRYNKVPMIIGYTDKEGMNVEFWREMTPEGFRMTTDLETMVPLGFRVERGGDVSKKIAKMMKDFYFRGAEPAMDMIGSFYDLETDRLSLRGLYMSAKHHVASSPTTPLYFYRFSIDRGLNLFKNIARGKNPGASHCDDVGYLFQTKLFPPPDESSVEYQLVEKMVALWTNFARNGDPSVGAVIWRPVTMGRFVFMDIGDELVEGVDMEKERMEFWDEISAMTPFAKDM